MLTIRADQLKALAQAPEEAFVESLAGYARGDLGIWVNDLSPEALRNRIESGVARARSHGFKWQSSIAKYVALMLRFSPNFDEYPPIAALLNQAGADREARADQLFDEITPEQWLAVEDRYDPHAWYDFGAGPMR